MVELRNLSITFQIPVSSNEMYNLSTATLERSEHAGLCTPLSAIPLLPTDQINRGKKSHLQFCIFVCISV